MFITGQHGAAASSFAASNPELKLLGQSFACSACVSSHLPKILGSLNVCVWCPPMDWGPIQDAFPNLAQCFQDRFQIHHNPDWIKLFQKMS